MARVERWPKLLHGPVGLSDCVVQGQVDQDLAVLAATLTAGKLHAVPADALAVLRAGFEVSEAPLTPEEFCSQVKAALILKADSEAWFRQRAPEIFELGWRHKSDLAERPAQLRRWLGLPGYEPIPRVPGDPLPLVLPPPVPVTGLRLAGLHRAIGLATRWRTGGIGSGSRCLDGERAAPPETCKGEQDYEMLPEARKNPDDEDNEALLEEFGAGFDPEWFDRAVSNGRLARPS